jgi:transcriptional regulator with XRE-family HTH domain
MHDPATLVRSTRLRAGLTQAELARRAGVTQPVVSRAETHGANPRYATLDRLVRAAGARLELSAAPVEISDVDEGQIRELLRLKPEERLRRHDAARRGMGGLLSGVRVLD